MMTRSFFTGKRRAFMYSTFAILLALIPLVRFLSSIPAVIASFVVGIASRALRLKDVSQ
jgi:hypothetical protein